MYNQYKRILVNMLKHSTSKRLTEFNHDKYPQQIMIYQKQMETCNVLYIWVA